MRDTTVARRLYAHGVRGRIATQGADTPESASPPGEAAGKFRNRNISPSLR